MLPPRQSRGIPARFSGGVERDAPWPLRTRPLRNSHGVQNGCDGVDAPPTATMCQSGGAEHHLEEASVGKAGCDPKNSGQGRRRKKPGRSQVVEFFSAQPPCTMAMEFLPNRVSCTLGQACDLPSDTQGRSRVPELGSLGSGRGRSAMSVYREQRADCRSESKASCKFHPFRGVQARGDGAAGDRDATNVPPRCLVNGA